MGKPTMVLNGVAYVEPPGPVRDESKRRAVPIVRWPRTWMEV